MFTFVKTILYENNADDKLQVASIVKLMTTLITIEKLEAGEFEDSAYFEPFYLKEFQATTPKKLL
mgnify:CR=1 FL=1